MCATHSGLRGRHSSKKKKVSEPIAGQLHENTLRNVAAMLMRLAITARQIIVALHLLQTQAGRQWQCNYEPRIEI